MNVNPCGVRTYVKSGGPRKSCQRILRFCRKISLELCLTLPITMVESVKRKGNDELQRL